MTPVPKPAKTTRPRWWWHLPSAVLIGVACHQIWLTRSANLTPWSGGGFGMFSTIDGWGNRFLQAFAVRPGAQPRIGDSSGATGGNAPRPRVSLEANLRCARSSLGVTRQRLMMVLLKR